MRLSVLLVLVAAVIAVGVVLLLGQTLLSPNLPLITHAEFAPTTITPNADGSDDVALFSYGLSQNTRVSLSFAAEDGTTYAFRVDEPRVADDYQVQFSGVVDGFTLPGESFESDIIRRLMPNGDYTWHLTAITSTGESDERSGTITLVDGDAPLPDIQNFTVSPEDFTPNQDGINDRVQINLFLSKSAALNVFLLDEDGTRYFVPQRADAQPVGEPGRHWFDYDGGVDRGADPPIDGTYTVVAEAQDAVGQRTRQTDELTIRAGGKPLAQILPQPSGADVIFVSQPADDASDSVDPPNSPDAPNMMAITMPVGELLVFMLTIENYSDAPLRTTGPVPGTIYNFDERASTIGWYEESGAWRVGIDCENATSDYPWRWAIGERANLFTETDPVSGDTFYYLAPGERSVVWGAVRMTELVEVSNPQTCWAGLIHEDVEISLQNSRVGPREVELVEVDS